MSDFANGVENYWTPRHSSGSPLWATNTAG